MKPGYLKLQRSFFTHWLWDEKHSFSKAEAFLDLLQLAAFVPTKRMISGVLFDLQQGELVASVRYLSARWTWGKEKVCGFLKLLESDGMLIRETRQGITVLSLCNYSEYNPTQDNNPDSNRDSHKTPAGQLRDKVEEDKEDEEDILFPVKKTILPKGWKNLSKTEQGRKKINFNDPVMIRIGKFLGQRESTLWTIAEYLALQDVSPSEDDLDLIGQHYSLVIENNGYRFKDLLTLLNNWPKARTRAEAYFQEFPDHRAA